MYLPVIVSVKISSDVKEIHFSDSCFSSIIINYIFSVSVSDPDEINVNYELHKIKIYILVYNSLYLSVF